MSTRAIASSIDQGIGNIVEQDFKRMRSTARKIAFFSGLITIFLFLYTDRPEKYVAGMVAFGALCVSLALAPNNDKKIRVDQRQGYLPPAKKRFQTQD